ncbi:MAG: hypothetical protein U1A78_07245 [Polyangia bacterium]
MQTLRSCLARPSRLLVPAALLLVAAAPAVAANPTAPGTAPSPGALTVIKPKKGFIDDAYAVSPDGKVLYYVNTDGATWAKLVAVGLPAPPPGAAPPPSAAPPPAPPPPAPAKGKGTGKGKEPAPAFPIVWGLPPAPPQPSLAVAPGETQELLLDVPLSSARLYLLPEDRVLIVSRDTETDGLWNGDVYSLKTRSKVAVAGGIGPVSDITLGHIGSDWVIVQYVKPLPRKPDLKVSVLSASTLKPLGRKEYDVGDDAWQIKTAQGSGAPLYFLDDYLTWAVKHGGAYDKKKDIRQPDFLAFVDTLTGKVRASRPITDPQPLLDLAKLRKDRASSLVVVADEATQKVELVRAEDRGQPEGPTESRGPLPLVRDAVLYDEATLRYQLAAPGVLVASMNIDPVNEKAVAQKRSDPDDLDVFAVDLSGPTPGPAQKLLTLPGQKRPSSWAVTAGGRLVLLRKHKGFSRGGTEVEVFDVKLPAAAAPAR